jgi:hypothetical protein
MIAGQKELILKNFFSGINCRNQTNLYFRRGATGADYKYYGEL